MCPEVTNLTLRRDTIVTVLALLVIAIALPFAIVDTFQTGRVYLFSRQFLEELPQRFTGPGRLRFVLQPMTAILLGIRGGLRDARTGKPPYLFGLIFSSGHRREFLRSGVAAIRNLLALGIIMDIVFQLILYRNRRYMYCSRQQGGEFLKRWRSEPNNSRMNSGQ